MSLSPGLSSRLRAVEPTEARCKRRRSCLVQLGALTPLLMAMRQHVPTDEHVMLVVEDDEPLASLLGSAGASLRHELLHLEGAL